jgi:hypothetical protein
MINQNLMAQLNQLRSNPVQFLMRRRMNIPQDVANDPNAIVQHLLNTGQISQQQYNQAVQAAQQFMRRQ